MTNFNSVKKFMEVFGQEVMTKAEFPSEKIIKLRLNLIQEELDEFDQALKNKDLNKSLMLYREVMNIDKSSDSSKIAAYFLGMHFDYEVSLIDSAKYYYEFLSKNFPDSAQAANAIKRLEVLNAE